MGLLVTPERLKATRNSPEPLGLGALGSGSSGVSDDRMAHLAQCPGYLAFIYHNNGKLSRRYRGQLGLGQVICAPPFLGYKKNICTVSK